MNTMVYETPTVVNRKDYREKNALYAVCIVAEPKVI